MTAEDNKARMRRYYIEVWQHGNMAVSDELIAPDAVDHMPLPGQAAGRAGHDQLVHLIRRAFPDAEYTIDDLIAEGDRTVGRWTMRATHRGELMGVPPTGNAVVMSGIDIVRWQNGQLVEIWHIEDRLSMLQQLGVIPSRAQAVPSY